MCVVENAAQLQRGANRWIAVQPVTIDMMQGAQFQRATGDGSDTVGWLYRSRDVSSLLVHDSALLFLESAQTWVTYCVLHVHVLKCLIFEGNLSVLPIPHVRVRKPAAGAM